MFSARIGGLGPGSSEGVECQRLVCVRKWGSDQSGDMGKSKACMECRRADWLSTAASVAVCNRVTNPR